MKWRTALDGADHSSDPPHIAYCDAGDIFDIFKGMASSLITGIIVGYVVCKVARVSHPGRHIKHSGCSTSSNLLAPY